MRSGGWLPASSPRIDRACILGVKSLCTVGNIISLQLTCLFQSFVLLEVVRRYLLKLNARMSYSYVF